MMKSQKFPCRQTGLSLVELLVGVVIGMIAILVAYQSFEGVERARRTATSVGDLQSGGLYALFLTSVEAGKAGTAISANEEALSNCFNDLREGFFPVPVLVNRGTGAGIFSGSNRDANSDQLYVFSANPKRLVMPVELTAPLASTDTSVQVLAPLANSFSAGDRVVFSNNSGTCASAVVETNGALNETTGITTFMLKEALSSAFNVRGTKVLNLGPDAEIIRQVYWLGTDGVFRRTKLAGKSTQDRVDPIFSNVERFRVQYGVTTAASSSVITSWEDPTGAWSPSTLEVAPYKGTGTRIKALRVSFVIRGDEPEKGLAGEGFEGYMFNDCGGLGSGNCPEPEKFEIAATPGEVTGWRYRIFETAIPLRNNIWN